MTNVVDNYVHFIISSENLTEFHVYTLCLFYDGDMQKKKRIVPQAIAMFILGALQSMWFNAAILSKKEIFNGFFNLIRFVFSLSDWMKRLQ